ncbi:MAG: 50S ribosomal protein L35 [Magnetococcales bacterium]|nr:50S ribosomal protein L35 [Magnetococcales bacterium]MBF0157317.1 50S ribosomal protein L35 [Magnetococcales bacterium]
MPKIKTHRGAAKRFKVTGSGRVRRSNAFKRHILTSKSTKRKRNMRMPGMVADVDVAAVRRMMPGSF